MEDIKKMNDNEIKKSITEKQEKLRSFRFGISGGKTKNVKEGRTLRREIAQLFTELTSRALQA